MSDGFWACNPLRLLGKRISPLFTWEQPSCCIRFPECTLLQREDEASKV